MGLGVCPDMAVVTRKELLSGRWHREKDSSVYRLMSEVEQLLEQGCSALETLEHKEQGLEIALEEEPRRGVAWSPRKTLLWDSLCRA